MKNILSMFTLLIALGACSRPETPPPTTPVQPPTVQTSEQVAPTSNP